MNDTNRAYIAGIIDGEGCITLSKSVDTRTKNCLETYRPFITVETTSYELQQYLANITGQGKVKRNAQVGNHKDRYLWCLAGKKVIQKFLLEIQSYLVIKKKHAEVMLDFLSKDNLHNKRNCIQKHLDIYRTYREIFAKLNYRGRIENRVNSGKPKREDVGNPELSFKIANRLEESAETRVEETIIPISARHESDDIVRAQ